MRFPSILAAAPLLAASVLGAQNAPAGRIEGVITDSAHARPAAGAVVMLTRLAPEPTQFLSAGTDEKGRFRFDSLVAGRYSVAFATSFLDSLELTMPEREVILGVDERARVDFATPSGTLLRAGACPGVALRTGQGAVIGRVTDADTDTPLAGAQVAVSWTDLAVDRTTLQPTMQQRGGVVTVDSLGQYRLCGVPTENYLLVQVQRNGRVGSTLRLSVPDDAGVVLRHLSLSAEGSRSIAALDSAARDTTSDLLPVKQLTGTATLAGTVRGTGGQPLSDAQLRVLDAVGTTRSDSLGRFTLTNLPAGTQLLEARRVGYLLGQFPVELRGGRTVAQEVTLTHIVSLDSIRVVAQRARYREFESRVRRGGFGRFMNEQDIERRNATETSDLIRTMPGFRISGFGLDAKIVSARGVMSLRQGQCETNIVIDGIQHQDINLLSPRDVGAIEAYSGPAGAPMQYDNACGVIVIWTKR